MRPYEAHRAAGGQRTTRLWIVETLIVLGIVGFGYFALTLDAARWSAATSPAQSFDPIAELTR